MSLSAAWVLFGAAIAGCGIIKNPDGAAPLVGFFIAIIATACAFRKKKD